MSLKPNRVFALHFLLPSGGPNLWSGSGDPRIMKMQLRPRKSVESRLVGLDGARRHQRVFVTGLDWSEQV